MDVDSVGISIPLHATGNLLGVSFSVPDDILTVAGSILMIPLTSSGSSPAWYGLTVTLLYSALSSDGKIRPIVAVSGVPPINSTFAYTGSAGSVSFVSFNLAGVWPLLDGRQSYAIGLSCNVSSAVTWLYSLGMANDMPTGSNIGVVQINGVSIKASSSSSWTSGPDGSRAPAVRFTGTADESLPEDASWPLLFDNTIRLSTSDNSVRLQICQRLGH